MYFSADAGDGFHVWRQRFPDGAPQQLTSGATEEEGLALDPDGRSLITSVGVSQRSVWIHDASGDRQISLEGYAYYPLMTADGKKVCFRITRGIGTGQSPSELWVADLASGQTQRLFPGQLVTGYDISRNDRVVAAVRGPQGGSSIWMAWLDGHEPPHPVPQAEGDNPRFGPGGEIRFRHPEGQKAFFYRIRPDGTDRERLFEVTSTVFGTVSPDGEWLSSTSANNSQVSLFSAKSELRVLPYSSTSRIRWTLEGTRAYLSVQYGQASAFATGRTYVLPLGNSSVLPAIPDGGFRDEQELAAVPGVEILPYGDVTLASVPGVYAFSRVTTTRNLYRIPLR
jgi:hypothetical protein